VGIGRTGWLAPAVAGTAAAAVIAALTLNVVNHGANAGLTSPVNNNIVFTLWGIAYTAAGGLITLRLPGNRVGWLLLGAGFLFAAASLLFEYANQALGPRGLVGGVEALFASGAIATAALALIPLALLVFPDDRLPGPRWRPLAWLCGGGIACLLIGYGITPGRLDPASHVTNPLGIGGHDAVIVALEVVGWMLVIATYAAAGYATVMRLRASDQATRQQVKWVAYAAAVLAVLWAQFIATTVTLVVRDGVALDAEVVIATCAMAGVPVAMGIAILRHHLFDIDVIIRRTLVYGLLVAALSGVYAAGVLGLTAALRALAGGTSALVVTLSTLAVAAAFQPLRTRIQHVVDHRFYRDQYDAAGTLEAFGRRLWEQVDLEALRTDILEVVETTVQPRQVTLWLAPSSSETSADPSNEPRSGRRLR
jgi:hypothetical protein